MNNKLQEILLTQESSITEAIQKIDTGSRKIALITDSQGKLLGTVSDGDIRRAILKGVSLDEKVVGIMNSKPIVATANDTKENLLSIMQLKQIQQMPVVDEKGILTDLKSFYDLTKKEKKNNLVFLMAGGLGTRLYPLTRDCPKPMLKIGNKPILETMILNLIGFGFNNFCISVNYKAEVITEYFGDGSQWDVEINYIHETKKLGTAGALSLIKERPQDTLLVMNGDLLTKVNFEHLLDFHNTHNSKATMCVIEHDFQVPYGVVNLNDQIVTQIEEKPTHSFFANAGIYCIEPDILELIPENTFLDMPDLFKKMLDKQLKPTAFPVREYWCDIGQQSDLEKAKNEFVTVFA